MNISTHSTASDTHLKDMLANMICTFNMINGTTCIHPELNVITDEMLKWAISHNKQKPNREAAKTQIKRSFKAFMENDRVQQKMSERNIHEHYNICIHLSTNPIGIIPVAKIISDAFDACPDVENYPFNSLSSKADKMRLIIQAMKDKGFFFYSTPKENDMVELYSRLDGKLSFESRYCKDVTNGIGEPQEESMSMSYHPKRTG